MQILLVHGLGRTPLSFVPLAAALRRDGHAPHLFGYFAAVEPWQRIVQRLRVRLCRMAERSPYAVVGHSLGGVLIAAALADPWPHNRARPVQVITLGTPVRPPRLAHIAARYRTFKLLAGQAGKRLPEARTYEALQTAHFPWTAIYGIGGPRLRVFCNELNDGVLAVSEAQADAADCLEVKVLHALLPVHARTRALVLQTIAEANARPSVAETPCSAG